MVAKMIGGLPDEIVVLIAVRVLDSAVSRIPMAIGSAEEAMYGIGSTCRRMRRLVKASLACRPDVWLRVSCCASAAACIAAFPDAPSLAVEGQVPAGALTVALRSRRARVIRSLCIGGVVSSERTARALMRTLASIGVRALDITIAHTSSIGLVSTLDRLTLLSSDIRTAACIARLTGLRELELSACHRLGDIASISALQSLRKLAISHCSRLRDVSALASLSGLVELSVVSTSHRLRGLAEVASLGSLRVLDVRRAEMDVGLVARIARLEDLKMRRAPTLHSLSALRSLSSLEYDGDGYDEHPMGLPALRGLTTLRLLRWDMPDELECTGGLLALRELHLRDIHQMRALPVHALTGLRVLRVHRCPDLEDAGAISGLVHLRELAVTSCVRLRDLTHVTRLTGLESLDITCEEPDDLGRLTRLTRLRSLRMWVAAGIGGLDALHRLSSLTELSIGSFPRTTDIGPIRSLVRARVSLTGCNTALVSSVDERDATLRAYPAHR